MLRMWNQSGFSVNGAQPCARRRLTGVFAGMTFVGAPFALVGRLVLVVCLLLSCADGESPRIDTVTELDNTFSPIGPYVVTASVTDDGRILQAQLIYRINGSEFFAAPMVAISSTVFQGVIPGQPVGTRIQYEVAVADNEGTIVRYPEGDDMFVFEVMAEP